MLLSTTRAMTLLYLLPVLLAHQPINVKPRASILRRMPMFYGKRSSPSMSSASLSLPADALYARLAQAGRHHAPDNDWPTDGFANYRNSARTRPEHRSDKAVMTLRQRFPNGLQFSDDVGSGLSWMMPTFLYKKLQDYIHRKNSQGMSAMPFNSHIQRFRNHQKRPQFYDSQAFKRTAASSHNFGIQNDDNDNDGYYDNGGTERLRNRLELLNLDHRYNKGLVLTGVPASAAEEETRELLPLKLRSSGQEDDGKDYVQYAYNYILDNVLADDDDENDDAIKLSQLYLTNNEGQEHW